MSDINTSKVDGNTVSAAEFNQLAEINNLISTSGQTPSTTNLEQISIGSARYSSAGQFFTDSGTANAYVLSSVSPFKSPVSATAGEGYFNGMVIRFRAGNPNTGASTVNVNGAGVKNLKKTDGRDVTTGDILTTTDVAFRYDGTNFIKLENVNPATNTIQGISYLPQRITIANNTTDANNDIDFSAGNFIFTDNSGQAYVSAMTKRLDANWTAGNNNGGLDTGTKASYTWYYCYAIYNPTTQASDFLFSASATSPTLPSGFTKFSYKGSILTNGSGNIVPFEQNGNYFEWKSAINDYSGNLTTAETLTTLSVPLGFINYAKINYFGIAASAVINKIFLRNPALTSRINTHAGVFGTNGSLYDFGGETEVFTNNLSEILISTSNVGNLTLTNFNINTLGYFNYSI